MTLQVFFKKTRKEIPVDFSTFPGGEEYVRAHVSEKDIDMWPNIVLSVD